MTTHNLKTTRRGFLTAGSVTALTPPTAFAQTTDTPSLDDYSPEFFSPEEWTFVRAATARLIPSGDDGPGATEARVPVFIDRQLGGDYGQAATLYMEGPFVADADPQLGFQSPLTPAQIYRDGIVAFEKWCENTQGGGFATLDDTTQDAALTALDKGETGARPEIRDFFSLLLQNTQEGFFADPMYGGNHGMVGWLHVGFPGARASFLEWTDPALDQVPYPLGPVSISGERA